MNIKTGNYQWNEPDYSDNLLIRGFLTISEIREAVGVVSRRQTQHQELELKLVRLQAFCRGCLVRHKVRNMKTAAISIQVSELDY